ncbi:MAG: aldehyde dehydrogenase [Sulfuricurvum sp. PC08-66]|nr:MAG: aldehyde dehydrogenase [Sulfuricurvum sp. PC08-66]
MTIETVLSAQRAFFATNATKSIAFRKAQLSKLRAQLKANEALLFEAIYEDFHKSVFETYATEIGFLYHEIDVALKNLARWSKPKRLWSDIANFPSFSYIVPEPLGCVLVIGAWNYPYQLSLAPAIAALASGNTVVLKPSEIAPRTSSVMASLINSAFEPNTFCVLEGGVEETTAILAHAFDKIFFTGSTAVGRIIYEAAAKHLTPVVLELGGKSPTFVLADAHIALAAKRIAWAKFLNAGQTCIAPDYIVVDKRIKGLFIEALKREIATQFQDIEGENYVQIINERNFKRLHDLAQIPLVSDKTKRLIAPTLIEEAQWEDSIMSDEIFGPILPIIAFDDLEEVIATVKARPKPLACYVYTQSKINAQKIIDELSFGGGAVNDSVMHLTNSRLPFGGVGASGIGSYHGKYGFDTFSHHKSVLVKWSRFELSLKYAPYTRWKYRVMQRIFG